MDAEADEDPRYPAGPGTKVVCLGNIAQIDTPYTTEGSSGLTYVVGSLQGLGTRRARDTATRRALASGGLRCRDPSRSARPAPLVRARNFLVVLRRCRYRRLRLHRKLFYGRCVHRLRERGLERRRKDDHRAGPEDRRHQRLHHRWKVKAPYGSYLHFGRRRTRPPDCHPNTCGCS